MDDKRTDRPSGEAEEKVNIAIGSGSIGNPDTKKRSAATHESSDGAQTARKKTCPQCVDEGGKNVGPSLHRTPATKRMAALAGLRERETIVYATDMESQIAAEARGVTRKNIPWDIFCSIYLCDFSVEAQPKLAVTSVKEIGEENWEEQLFWDRLRQSLSDKVR